MWMLFSCEQLDVELLESNNNKKILHKFESFPERNKKWVVSRKHSLFGNLLEKQREAAKDNRVAIACGLFL